jgi:hypothetical protein
MEFESREGELCGGIEVWGLGLFVHAGLAWFWGAG